MSNELVGRIAIREENAVREEIASHPLFQDVKGLANVDRASTYEAELKKQLRCGTELSLASHPKLFTLCDEAMKILGLDADLRVFKSREGGGIENAFVMDRDRDVLLVFQEGILATLDDDKSLLAVIGHELGHLAFGHTNDVVSWSVVALDSRIAEMDEGEAVSKALGKELNRLRRDAGWDELVVLMHLLRQIGELNADRAGLICARDFDTCVTAAMTLSGGPADRFGKYDPEDFLAQGRKLVELGDIFDEADWYLSHPLQPLRVLALEYFANSDSYRELTGNGTGKNTRTGFSKLLPSIVPMDILGGAIETQTSPEVSTPRVAASLASRVDINVRTVSEAMTALEIDTLTYMCMASIVGADGKITPAERIFLEQQVRPAAALDAVHQALDALSEDGLSTELDRLLAKAQGLSTRVKGALVKRMIKAAKADRRVVQEEIDRIRELAASMAAAEQAEREIANAWGR